MKLRRVLGYTVLLYAVFMGVYFAFVLLRRDPCEPLLELGRPPTESEVRACMGDDEYNARYDAYKARVEAERVALESETAPWFGQTGLPLETERHVAEYVRLEFGQAIGEEGALKASDLSYVGSFQEEDGTLHYWEIPGPEEPIYVYVRVGTSAVTSTGLGGRIPPTAPAS